MINRSQKNNVSLFTPEEEALLRGRFADTWTGRLSILVVAVFLGFLGVWVFTSMMAQAKTVSNTPTPSQGLVHLHKFFKGFHIAGVTMGMTPNMVRTLHPKFEINLGNTQITRGSFVAEHTPYTVWFAKLAGYASRPRQVYRIRYHRRYSTDNENKALNDFGLKLGRPLSTSCTRSRLTTSSKTCIFKWLRNGVDVTMVNKLIHVINADPRIYVSITATDTLIAAKLKRQQDQQQLARSRVK